MAFIYGLHLPGEEIRYVGQTVRTKYAKTRDYRSRQKRSASSSERPLMYWLVKHVDQPVQLVVIEECSEEELDEREIYWIAEYKRLGYNLLNVHPGGRSSHGWSLPQKKVLSEKHRANISAGLTGHKRGPRGRAGTLQGVELEARAKAAHTRWHTKRGLHKDGCAYC